MHAEVVAKVDPNEVHKADISALLCHNGLLFSGDDAGELMAWTGDLKKLGEVKAHNECVSSMAAIGDTIYTCSDDGTIKAWSMDLKLMATLANEDCKFWKVTVSENMLFAGTNQGLIYLFENNALKFKLEIHDGIKDMVISDNNVISVKDMNIIVTELMKGGKCNKKTSFPGNSPLLLIEDKLLVISENGLDVDIHENSAKLNYEKITTLKDAHRQIINGLVGIKKNDESFVYTAGWDRMVKQWRLLGSTLEKDTYAPAGFVVNDIVTPEAGSVYAGGEHGHLIHVIFSN